MRRTDGGGAGLFNLSPDSATACGDPDGPSHQGSPSAAAGWTTASPEPRMTAARGYVDPPEDIGAEAFRCPAGPREAAGQTGEEGAGTAIVGAACPAVGQVSLDRPGLFRRKLVVKIFPEPAGNLRTFHSRHSFSRGRDGHRPCRYALVNTALPVEVPRA